jgi:hypothetical protein
MIDEIYGRRIKMPFIFMQEVFLGLKLMFVKKQLNIK